MTDADICQALKMVINRIKVASENRKYESSPIIPRLVAVSKTKSKDQIILAYKYGHRHFGENYVQELLEKANDPDVQVNCPDIKWHFIGHLQSNKVKKVVSTKNLYIIETVDSEKLAHALDDAWSKLNQNDLKLKVFIQVNTSNEESKSGIALADAPKLVEHVLSNCPNLEVCGLMTIGVFGHDPSQGVNPDFIKLREIKKNICNQLSLDASKLELSMGMSSDFEQAIEMGSTSVRVGSLIFGVRS